MLYLGPIGEAASGAHNSPLFDLVIGFAVLALTWVGFSKRTRNKKVVLWVAIAISAICAVFILSGIQELLR
jgi:hypothetical protein